MKNMSVLRAASAALFLVLSSAAFAQSSGSVTNHALPIGKGPGTTGFGSLPLGSGQIAIGQTSADPTANTLSGDVTMGATGVTAIGATKVTSGMLNSSVFSTAHTWAGQQTFVAPILGTITSGDGSALTGTASGFTAGHVTTNANLTGDVTSSGNATTLTNAPVIAKVLTGFTSGAGTVTAADSILSAIQKVYGNNALNLPLAGGTMLGNIAMGGNAITGGGAITGTAITGTSYSGLPTATTSVLGVVKPDGATITIAGGVITASGGSATAITSGTTNVVSGTSHGVLTDNAGTLGTTGAGLTGQSLVSNGTSAEPTYKSGAWVLLNTLTASNSATLTDTTSISSAYTEYEVVLEQVIPATNAVSLQFQFQVGGTFQSTNYLSTDVHGNGTSSTSSSITSGVQALQTSGALNTSTSGTGGRWLLSNPAQTLTCKLMQGTYAYLNSTVIIIGATGGCYNGGSGAITGVQLLATSGNITSGVMKIYGRVN